MNTTESLSGIFISHPSSQSRFPSHGTRTPLNQAVRWTGGIFAMVAATLLATSTASAHVKLESGKDTVEVSVDGKPFMTFHYGEQWPKPYFSPVKAADGTVLTRGIENPKDHPHHKGIWLSVDEVNGVKFWAERGKIVTKSVKVEKANGDPAVMSVVNEWVGPDGDAEIVERTTISIYENRLIAYDVTFDAANKDAEFEDTKEGLFGFRMVDALREVETGKVLNSDGKKGTAECWGQQANWVDYTGLINEKPYGVTIFDHPENFRRSRYHVRNYGLFSISPFGEKAYTKGKNPSSPLHLKKGSEVRIRYGMYVHDGGPDAAKVPQVYEQYVKDSK